MPLNSAHEGYEYQDLLTSFFILKEILNENDSTFKIDTKEYQEDKVDDLTITNSFGVFKKQIKYSNEITNQQLQKEFLSQEGTYKLAVDTLFYSWNSHPHKNDCEVRICLAWQEPMDELNDVLKLHSAAAPSFSSHTTQTYQIDINKLWKNGQSPLQSWKRFKKESVNIDRTEFEIFCNHLVIETNFPKQSPNTSFTGELETIVLDQIKKLGIGEFPNDRSTPKDFALGLIQLVRRSRSRGLEIKIQDIFKKLNIQTNFGSIEQVFPIDNLKNIKTENNISKFKTILSNESKIILTGEPGSGKSWFIQNLQNELQSNYKIIKHYCYTELKDKHLKDRITLNVFCGNLINDTISIFPLLKEKKEQIYASNLNELNNLLQSISEETLLIIDGLDHIDRIYEFNRSELTLNDIAIIEAINQLQPADKVKILVVSQPIKELQTLSKFKRFEIPNWTKSEILAYFSKNNISDIQITEDKLLSEFFFEKSNGNPLYIHYLCEEISKLDKLSPEKLEALPAYSFNLTNYYEYLINKLNTNESIPRILSGATFSLSKTELDEITGEGDCVEEMLGKLSPILKQNNSQGGYIIYHESFRRFIIERLQSSKVSVYKTVFKPLIEWFEGKGFYNFPKAYRFYFQLLYENQKFEKILAFLNNNFVTESIYYGYSFDSVKNNYHYLAKSALRQKNFPKIILTNEINKVLSSTEDAYHEGFSLYLSALGYLRGFKVLADHIVFEGKPSLPLLLGLKACYQCDQDQEPAPWGLYFEYFNAEREIPISDFKYYIRGLFVFKNTEELIKMAEKIISQYPQYIESFTDELSEYHNSEYINELKSKTPVFDEIINYVSQTKIDTSVDLLSLSQQILDIKQIFEDNLPLLESFFVQIKININDTALINQITKLFVGKNWFYNWLIYGIKIYLLQTKSNISYYETKEAFQFLIYDTEPFKGNPRACDLYSAQDLIYKSLVVGLKFIKTSEEWDEIIELLVKLSEDTTTSLEKSINGPLSTDILFQILDEKANDINREKIIQIFERLISEKQDDHLHSYMAEYCFRLSKQYSIIGHKDKAEINYEKGIKFLIGYTFRRDLTIEDIVNAIESYANFDFSTGNEYLKKMKSLIDAVTHHTDGKDTTWFPVEWFQKYLTINFKDASLYLLSQIKKKPYYWIYEEQLKDLLIKATGEINPIIELFIYRSFPIEASEDFLAYGLTLVEKVKAIEYDLAKRFLSSLSVKSNNKRNQGFNNSFLTKLNQLLTEFGFDNSERKIDFPKKKEYHDKISATEFIKANSVPRKQLLDMAIQELIEYFSKHKIKETDLISLCYYFDSKNILTPEIKELIKIIVEKNEDYPKNKDLNLSVVFEKENDISAYYWVCQFIIEQDGWYRNLHNIEAFKKAYSLNPELAINSIIELSDKFLQIGFNRSFSSNLLNALIKIGYQPDTIKEMWNTLYSATEFRLPAKEEIDWNELLSDDLDMDIEEIFICILFSRFKSNTTERHHWTLSGLVYLYQLYPEKMIKPTKWFLHNYKHFLKVNLLIILEILYDIRKENSDYHKNFEEELNALYPSNYYLIDFIISKLLSKSKALFISSSNLLFTATQNDVDFFKSLNYRNEILHNKDFDLETVVGKFKSSFKIEYGKAFEFLGNVLIKQCVKNIYPANYQLELINKDLYNQFSEYDNQLGLYVFLQIHYKTIVAQTNSYSQRPSDIEKPSSITTNWQHREVVYSDWIRLAYYEYEMHEEGYSNNKEYRVFEGIVFKNDIKETIPFSRYRLFPIHIWEHKAMNGLDEFLCLFLSQRYDKLEDYNILWLNPIIINKLNLKVENHINGLAASNYRNEIVLKYSRWSSDYVGNGEIADIRDEIPRLEGGELICHRDYFEKICELYKNESNLYRLKI